MSLRPFADWIGWHTTEDAACKDLLAGNGLTQILSVLSATQDHHLQKCLLNALQLLSLRADGAKQLKANQVRSSL